MMKSTGLAGLLLAFVVTAAPAAEVTVKGVHLCCGACVSTVGKTLKTVKGVSGATCDRNSKIVTFQAADGKAAQAGILALAKAGFHGKATHGKTTIAFPKSGAKKGVKANTVTLNGVHLCCGACVTGARKAFAKLDSVGTIDIDRSAKTITLKGKGISVTDAVAALNKSGFHGTLKARKSTK